MAVSVVLAPVITRTGQRASAHLEFRQHLQAANVREANIQQNYAGLAAGGENDAFRGPAHLDFPVKIAHRMVDVGQSGCPDRRR